MNTKIKAIIAGSLVFASAIPVVACARKLPEAILLPIAEPAIIETTETETALEQKSIEINVPVEYQNPVVETVPTQPSMEAQELKKVETKKTTKKETKKTKKTAKKETKKTKKKSGKKATAAKKFTYGHSEYSYKKYTVYVDIKKDNTVSITVKHDRSKGDTTEYYYFDFSGKVNPKTGFMVYSNGSKETVVKNSHVHQVRMEYLNKGHGNVTFNGKTLTWFDGRGHYADDVTFVKN